jgi:hypothetical protein
MESFLLRSRLSAILDEPERKRTFYDASGVAIDVRRAVFVDPGFVSLRRAFNQIWRLVSRPRFHHLFPVRSDRTAEDSSIPIFDGGRGALLVLSAAPLNL